MSAGGPICIQHEARGIQEGRGMGVKTVRRRVQNSDSPIGFASFHRLLISIHVPTTIQYKILLMEEWSNGPSTYTPEARHG